jgi:hypothetical protein
MSKNLVHFLAEIATDPNKLGEFQKNPDEVMRAAGLSEDEIKAVKGGDVAALQGLLCSGEPGSALVGPGLAIHPVRPCGILPVPQVPWAIPMPLFGAICIPVLLLPVVPCISWPFQIPLAQVPTYPGPAVYVAPAPGSAAKSPPNTGEPPVI